MSRPTHGALALAYQVEARKHANRGERDAYLDSAEAYNWAAITGKRLAAAAETSTDPNYVRRLCTEHCARLLVLPVPEEELSPTAA